MDQHLGSQVNHSEAISQDGRQLLLDTQVDDVWQGIAIDFKGLGIGHLRHLFFRPLNIRGVEVFLDYLNVLKTLQELVGIGDDNLTGQVLTQEAKLIQHFIGCPEMGLRQGCWLGIFT